MADKACQVIKTASAWSNCHGMCQSPTCTIYVYIDKAAAGAGSLACSQHQDSFRRQLVSVGLAGLSSGSLRARLAVEGCTGIVGRYIKGAGLSRSPLHKPRPPASWAGGQLAVLSCTCDQSLCTVCNVVADEAAIRAAADMACAQWLCEWQYGCELVPAFPDPSQLRSHHDASFLGKCPLVLATSAMLLPGSAGQPKRPSALVPFVQML